jgi:hypothetical protein
METLPLGRRKWAGRRAYWAVSISSAGHDFRNEMGNDMNIKDQVEKNSSDWARSSGRPGGREVERTFPRAEGQRQEPALSGGYLERPERDRDRR